MGLNAVLEVERRGAGGCGGSIRNTCTIARTCVSGPRGVLVSDCYGRLRGPSLAYVGRRRSTLAVVGLCWPLWVYVGLREPTLAFVGSTLAYVGHCWCSLAVMAFVDPRWLLLAYVGLPELMLAVVGPRSSVCVACVSLSQLVVQPTLLSPRTLRVSHTMGLPLLYFVPASRPRWYLVE